VRGLVGLGHEVTLYCTSLRAEIPGVRRTVETLVVGRRRVPRRAVGVARAAAYHDWRVARELTTMAGEVDIVHCWGLAGVRTLRAAKAMGARCMREVPNTHTGFAHERASREAEAVGVRMPRRHSHSPNPRRLGLESAEFALADDLLVPSDYVARTFLERGFPPDKLARHQYGFDPARFPAPQRIGPSDGPLRAVFVGLGEPRKGLHHALEAWLASGAAETGTLVVCGRLLPAYQRRLADRLAHPSVDVRGFASDVGAVMRSCHLLLLPSVEEGSALVTYEAQGSGCALVVSDATGALCRHGDHGLVHEAGDVEALTRDLASLDRDRRLLRRMRERALAHRPELTWTKASERLEAIYRSRLSAPSRP
jgi:glycosyltransferase involved in cell wall biosynthesis